MSDTTVKKSAVLPAAARRKGQLNLASGKSIAMRMWKDEAPGEARPASRRNYETVGYVIGGPNCQSRGAERRVMRRL